MYLLNSFFAVLVSGNWLISVPSWIEIEARTGSLSVLRCVKLCSIIGILDLERGGLKMAILLFVDGFERITLGLEVNSQAM